MNRNQWIGFVINRYSKSLVRYSAALCKDKPRAKKIAFDCLQTFIQKDPPLPREKTKEWLFAECRRRSILPNESPTVFDGLEHTVLEKKTPTILMMSLMGLETLHQEVLWLGFRERLSVREMGSILGLGHEKICQALDEGIDLLQNSLSESASEEIPIERVEDSLQWELSERPKEGLTNHQLSQLQPAVAPIQQPKPHSHWKLASLATLTAGIVSFMLLPKTPEKLELLPHPAPKAEVPIEPVVADSPPSRQEPTKTVSIEIPEVLKKEFANPSANSNQKATKRAATTKLSRKPPHRLKKGIFPEGSTIVSKRNSVIKPTKSKKGTPTNRILR